MKNRKMLILTLFSITLALCLIAPAYIAGASATISPSDAHSFGHSMVDPSDRASAMALNTSQGYVTPMVAASFYHMVGLKSDGTVIAVGDNLWGQCDVDGWTDIVQVAAGHHHVAGLRADGTVVAIGSNEYGQCDVGDWTDIVQITAGLFHTVGVKSDGTVVAAGSNYYPRMWLPEDYPDVWDGKCAVGNWTDIVQVAAGTWHTVGVKSDGTVVAAGLNYHTACYPCTEIWDGKCEVDGWTDILQVAAGWYHTVGLKSDGTVVAAGTGGGDVSSWTNIVQIAVGLGEGYSHTVGLRSDGTVVAVGADWFGQCDVGDWTDILQIAGGGAYTAGLKADGSVVAMGMDYYGQCEVGDWAEIVQVATGLLHTVGLKSDGTVVAVGHKEFGQCEVGDWTDIIQVAAGRYHTVGLKPDGTVVATIHEGDVSHWTDIVQVAAGNGHTAGLKSNGTVVAVGNNNDGQCNVGNWTDIVQITAGYGITAGLKNNGTVVSTSEYLSMELDTWTDIIQVSAEGGCVVGLKSDGTVNSEASWHSIELEHWSDIVEVASGFRHTVGLKSDGTVVAAGDNSAGQCNVGNWADIIQVAAGEGFYTVGLKSDGTVVVAGPEVELAKILLLIKTKLNSPAEIRVRDSEGHVTGVIDGEIQDEIPWAIFNQEDESITLLYGFDTYFYEVEGISSGTYGLTMDVLDEGQTTTFSAVDVPITPDEIHRYYIDWYACSRGERGITIEKDYDGDGEIDEVIITGIPMPTNPSPIDNATEVPLDQELGWVVGDSGAVTYDVYFGNDMNPPLVSEAQGETTYAPTLNPDTTYYWRVTALNEDSIFTTGELWEFTTGETVAPWPCFIATATYSTPMAEEVQILREFRDRYLLNNPLGQALVNLYYKFSPPMAEFITEHPALKPIVRVGLMPAVVVSTVAVNTTAAEKIVILSFVALVSVVGAIWVTRRRGRYPKYT